MRNRFEVRPDGTVKVSLQRGLVMLVDLEDLPRVAALPGTWGAIQTKGRTYARMQFKTRGCPVTILAHRLIAATREGFEKDLVIDHVSGDGLDNRRSNPREVTRAGTSTTGGEPRSARRAASSAHIFEKQASTCRK